MVLEKVDRVLY